jgi:DNA-directed RNA polymerase III subunit RPC3
MEASVLCQHVVRTLYGPLVGRVATVLLDRGRMPFAQICRLVQPIKPQDVRYALMILLQHRLIWQYIDTPYSSSTDAPDKRQGQDFYEPNTAEILHRLRFGTYVGMSEDIEIPGRPSSRGRSALLIYYLLKHGRRRISDLMEEVVRHPDCSSSRTELDDTLTFLVSQRYVEATTPLQSSCPLDRYRAIRTDKLAGHSSSAVTSKAKREAESAAREEFLEERASDLRLANEHMYGNSFVGDQDDAPSSRVSSLAWPFRG